MEIISEDSIFVVPVSEIKKETAEKEFQVGMAVLEKMDESILKKVPKSEPLDPVLKIEPKQEFIEPEFTNIGQSIFPLMLKALKFL